VLALSTRRKTRDDASGRIIPAELAIHWRVLWVSLLIFIAFCLLSRLDISIRHFSVPLILLILLLAPLPSMIGHVLISSPLAGRVLMGTTAVLALACVMTAVRAYPFYFSYINAFGFGRPGYFLVNDSNLDWNQALPEVKRFADQHGLARIAVDEYGFNDTTVSVPQSVFWNCQKPTRAEDGQWVAVSANMIMDGHNCIWLMGYPHEALAGGSMYAVHLPEHVPQAGSPGGPPLPSEYRSFAGAGFDMQVFFQGLIHDPARIPQAWDEMMARFQAANKAKTQSKP
jgi:hypothetical protein